MFSKRHVKMILLALVVLAVAGSAGGAWLRMDYAVSSTDTTTTTTTSTSTSTSGHKVK